ncbi:uncharacterized protein LOC111194243 [Astyanax mexicanus]|uniref:uncharacterized protein LOC111194243 n=1 Tax=Astyanax mexicanus TaxID=7994 RepID=UPI0020CB29BF|nr:uncharacterized protein LOC111194243 [Astyanax mexicanus]
MQSSSVLLCAVFITCLCYCDYRPDFHVIQTPSEVTVKDEDSMSIFCCWNKTILNVKVKLIKPNQSNNYLYPTKINSTCSEFSIKNACMNDTGLYICEVIQDIPRLDIVKGNGTTVTLQEKNKNKKCKDCFLDDVLIYILRCLPFITLLLVMCCFNRYTSKRTRPKTSRQNILNPEEQEGVLEEEYEEPGEEPYLNEELMEEGEWREVDAERGEELEPEERQEEQFW